jgi:DNA-binding IclR family transcriptional regulator
MARQNANGTYDLGPGALKLGMSALARLDIFKIADEEIETFTAETGATVLLAVLGPGGPTIVRWHTGSPPVVTSLAVGSVLSIPHSATGQVFLAYRSENDTKAFLAAELAKEPKLDLESVANLKQKVRDEGMALVGGTLIPGLNAIACPILNLQSQAVIVATVVSTGQLRRADTEIGKRLKQVCAKINAIVGGHPDLLA